MSTHRHHCPVSDPEHSAAAWLGQAGLYRTRLEAVQNGEQHLESVSADELFELAIKQVPSQLTEGRQHASPIRHKPPAHA